MTGAAPAPRRPLGVVLAGGAGSRLGGAKATAPLGGRPLVAYPLAALRAAGLEAVVVAKPDTALPGPEALGDAAVWHEPAKPLHPLAGIAWALRRAGGRALVVCAVDMPFVDAAILGALAAGAEPGAVVLAADQPLLGHYPAWALTALERAVAGNASARAAVAQLRPVRLHVAAPQRTLFNVNTPEELAAAEAMLAGQPKVKS